MADPDGGQDILLLKKTRISVFVDEVVPDVLVVTYECGQRIFQGALMDSTKKYLPCGISTLNPAFSTPAAKTNNDDNPLHAVSQRYAYTDPAAVATAAKKKNVQMAAKYRSSKMTVRLRPRQVLCSKCKGICNENSENVTRKRKNSEPMASAPSASAAHPNAKRSANAPVTRSASVNVPEVNASAVGNVGAGTRKRIDLKRTLVPKAPQELPNALSGNVNKINIDNNKKPLAVAHLKSPNNVCDSNSKPPVDINQLAGEHDSNDGAVLPNHGAKVIDPKLKRMLRKKRSVDSMEDLWDETVLDDANKNNNLNVQGNTNSSEPPCTNTRTIKICYGSQGEGTVLKIPTQIENLNVEDDLEENINVDDLNNKESNKAARKAMKKARKEAKRKIVVGSPVHASPRYSIGGSSPRYTIGSASPRHGLGNHSPRYATAVAALEPSTPKKRKHKMKHKKKHREEKDRKHKDGEISESDSSSKPAPPFLTQKLSINLKRLSGSYTMCPIKMEEEEEDSSGEEDDPVPDFPPSPPLLMRMGAQSISSALGADGERLAVGDVVWGKAGQKHPWWPGRVLAITDAGDGDACANVAWYGACTTSLLRCLHVRNFLKNFKMRFNKKKKGPYKEAIKQASVDAQEFARQHICSSPRPIISAVPTALASPREINVIS